MPGCSIIDENDLFVEYTEICEKNTKKLCELFVLCGERLFLHLNWIQETLCLELCDFKYNLAIHNCHHRLRG